MPQASLEASVKICRAWLRGVLAHVGHSPLGTTILNVGGEILGTVPFLEILGSSNDFSGATLLVLCGVDWGELVSL